MLKTLEDVNYYEYTYGPWTPEGRALANLLAGDNMRSLRHIGWHWTPAADSRDDFLQDFFLHITKHADGFNESFVGVTDLNNYEPGLSWVVACMKHYVATWWREKKRRLRKPKGHPRPTECSMHTIDRVGNMSYQLWLRDKHLLFPGRELMEEEETEYRKRQLTTIIETAMRQLTKAEQEVTRLFYLGGLTIPQIVRQTSYSRGSVRTRLWAARNRLREIMPRNIIEALDAR